MATHSKNNGMGAEVGEGTMQYVRHRRKADGGFDLQCPLMGLGFTSQVH